MTCTAIKTVGLVGLGAMGRGVAGNLIAKGYEVVGFDIDPRARQWLVERGGRAAASLADLGRASDLLISFVVNDAQTEAVLLGPDGAAPHLRPGTIVVTCSTQPPAYVKTLGERLARMGLSLVDAPVTGGRVGAEKGTLTIMVGGAPEHVEVARPVLATFGARIFVMGDTPGMGAQMKVINQLLCGVHLAAAGEAIALARRQGLPLDTTLEILRSGAASSWMLGDRGPRMVSDAYGDVTSAVDIFVKDLGLVLDAARDSRFSASLASTAFNAFMTASGRGMGRWDDAAVTLSYAGEPYAGDVPVPAKDGAGA